jgi:hypothetical protein
MQTPSLCLPHTNPLLSIGAPRRCPSYLSDVLQQRCQWPISLHEPRLVSCPVHNLRGDKEGGSWVSVEGGSWVSLETQR